MDTKQKLSTTSIALHWVIALFMIVLVSVGLYMVENEAIAMYYWHKSFGTLLFFIILYRVYWRFKQGWPPHAAQYKRVEQLLSKVVHWLLLVATLLFPISGFMLSGAGGYGIYIFELTLLAPNYDPQLDKVIPYNAAISAIGARMHATLGNVIIAAFILHLVGALKHHFIDKDRTLKRMLGNH